MLSLKERPQQTRDAINCPAEESEPISTFHHLFTEDSQDYAVYRPTYPEELYQRVFAWCSPTKELAIDVATGTGQAALVLSKSFEKVLAMDISQLQLANAPPVANVKYEVATAENLIDDLCLEEGSADLVTVAAALHWFDIPAFYEQCRCVLKSGGVLAAWSYRPYFSFVGHPSVTAAMTELGEGLLGRYWASPVELVKDKYKTLMPTDFFHRSEWFSLEVTKKMTMRRCIGYFKTLSAYKLFKKDRSDEKDPLEIFGQNAMIELGLEDIDQPFEIQIEIFGFLAKNPF